MTQRIERWLCWLLEPFMERWVMRYAMLAFLGTLLLVIGQLADARWQRLVGSGLWVPFILWVMTFFPVVLPGTLLVACYLDRMHARGSGLGRPDG